MALLRARAACFGARLALGHLVLLALGRAPLANLRAAGAVFVGAALHRFHTGTAFARALFAEARASFHFGPRLAAGVRAGAAGFLATGTGFDTAIEVVMFVHFALP